jgi:translation initiation factor 3 subunit H
MSAWDPIDVPTPIQTKNVPITEVHIDGLAVLKIVKHCKDALPKEVSGALLGLDQKGILEITHSFPGVSAVGGEGYAEEEYDELDQAYQLDMMASLREVNVDNNSVGWYQSMFLGTFNSMKLVNNLASYQASIANSVVILYDPIQTAKGSLTIRAFRLSKDFLDMTSKGSNDFISPSNILEELPLKIRNPGIITALLFDLKDNKSLNSSDFERLDLSTNPYLEKNLEYLSTWVDDLANEFKYQQDIRREKMRKKMKEGDIGGEDGSMEPLLTERLTSLIVSNQISQYCNQVQQFSGSSFGKLFLAGSLQKEDA